MFHTHVLATSGTVVDFDRASFLMDKGLLQQAIDAMRDERDHHPRHDARYGAQWVWDYYCQRHAEKCGAGFGPDVTPGWDQPTAPPLPPISAEENEAQTQSIRPLTADRMKALLPRR